MDSLKTATSDPLLLDLEYSVRKRGSTLCICRTPMGCVTHDGSFLWTYRDGWVIFPDVSYGEGMGVTQFIGVGHIGQGLNIGFPHVY